MYGLNGVLLLYKIKRKLIRDVQLKFKKQNKDQGL